MLAHDLVRSFGEKLDACVRTENRDGRTIDGLGATPKTEQSGTGEGELRAGEKLAMQLAAANDHGAAGHPGTDAGDDAGIEFERTTRQHDAGHAGRAPENQRRIVDDEDVTQS